MQTLEKCEPCNEMPAGNSGWTADGQSQRMPGLVNPTLAPMMKKRGEGRGQGRVAR